MATNLEQNTAGLEEILAAVNSLPEADSGGGYKVAVGTCTLYSKVTLDFKPVLVCVTGNSTSKTSTPTNVSCVNGVFNGVSYSSALRAQVMSSNLTFSSIGSEISLEDDGFKYSTTVGGGLSSYIYVAIGQ